MEQSIVVILLYTLLLFYCATIPLVDGLERKRREQAASATTEGECTVSDAGEKVCTAGNANTHDDEIFHDDDDDDDDVVDYDDDGGKDSATSNCIDTHELCSYWASLGECNKNPNYMLSGCPVSCKSCPDTLFNGLTREQVAEKPILLDKIQKYGVAQEVEERTQDKIMFVIRKTIDYMSNYIYADRQDVTHDLSQETLDACRNTNSLCAYWASIGECQNNPSFMVTKCAPSCLSCHKIDYNHRCGERDPNLPPGLKPGELNLMFERIVDTAPGNNTNDETQIFQEDGVTPMYTVTVHSRPESTASQPDTTTGVIQTDPKKDKREAPWVITFDNLLTPEECQYLIHLGHKNEYKRSTDVGGRLVDGSFDAVESQHRTSENSWCSDKSGCRDDEIVQRILNRLGNITGIPPINYEDLQMLKYEVGQYYKAHHDYIGHQKDRHSGPRILTFFLYLSDVEEGGGTRLNNLGIDIQPKVGRALLWPSVYNFDPSIMDGRTRHEALAVVKGRKFAANAWIHLYNNVEATKNGCN